MTYFRSREQAREKTWSGIMQRSGLEEELRQRGGRGESWRTGLGIGLCSDLAGKRRARQEKQAWCAMWARQSGPRCLALPGHCLMPPVNVIKQAGTRILQQAPILEASLHKECSSQKQGLTHVSHLQSGQCTLSDPVPALLHSLLLFSTFCLYRVYLAWSCRYDVVLLHLLLGHFFLLRRHRVGGKLTHRKPNQNTHRDPAIFPSCLKLIIIILP